MSNDEKMGDEKIEEFSDLEEKPIEKEEEKTGEELKKEVERMKRENETLMEKLTEQSAARAEARRLARERKQELETTRAKLEEMEKGTKKKNDENEEEKDDDKKEKIPAGTIDVDSVIDEKLYEKELDRVIRSQIKYREDAKLVKAYVKKMRTGGLVDGTPEDDVASAVAFMDIRRKRDATESMPSPHSVSGGYANEHTKDVERKRAMELGKVLGVSKEAWEKYGGSDEIDLTNKR